MVCKRIAKDSPAYETFLIYRFEKLGQREMMRIFIRYISDVKVEDLSAKETVACCTKRHACYPL